MRAGFPIFTQGIANARLCGIRPSRSRGPLIAYFATSCLLRHKIKAKETSIQSMNISLPESLMQFVERKFTSGRYSSVSEYARESECKKSVEAPKAVLLQCIQGKDAHFYARRQEVEQNRSLRTPQGGKDAP